MILQRTQDREKFPCRARQNGIHTARCSRGSFLSLVRWGPALPLRRLSRAHVAVIFRFEVLVIFVVLRFRFIPFPKVDFLHAFLVLLVLLVVLVVLVVVVVLPVELAFVPPIVVLDDALLLYRVAVLVRPVQNRERRDHAEYFL